MPAKFRESPLGLLLALVLWVAILDDGSGDGGPPDPLPPIETNV